MNMQKSTNRFLKVLLTSLMLATLMVGVLPAQTVHASSFLVNDLGDDPDPSLDGICDISPGDLVENCTLRAAIMEANQADDLDVISFSNNFTLYPATALPTITEPVTIDASGTGGFVTLDGGGGSFYGLNITSGNVTIRGLALINFDQIAVRVSSGASGVVLDGNHIGVTASGDTDGGNTNWGIRVIDSPNISITDNVVSGNDNGQIYISGASSNGAQVKGNTIGLNAVGDAILEDTPTTGKPGVRLSSVTNVDVGGAGADRNIISGNYGNGVQITGTSTGTDVSGNYIGTDAIGEFALQNLANGISISSASGVTVGAVSRNLISGNGASGVLVQNSSDTNIQGNIIGLDVDGDTELGNATYGINGSGSTDVLISSNTISDNGSSGIRMVNGSTGFNIFNNRIGIGTTQQLSLGNGSYGIYLDNSNDNLIGSTSAGNGNIIAYNADDAVYINNSNPGSYNSYGNTIIGNSMFSNGGLGIDLAPNGVTVNDTDDPDDGPNYLQNFLTFTAKQTATGVQITGELNTDVVRPNYRIEFFVNNTCDSSGYGEGYQLVDVMDIVINSSTTAIDYEIPEPSIEPGKYITATVTYDEGTGGLKDTSEFSPCAVVQEPDSPGSSGVFVVNSTADNGEAPANRGDGACNVGGGVCTLRAAIQEANAGGAPPYTITFNIAGASPHRITLGSELPAITVPLIMKGKPSGYSGPPIVEINGSGLGSGDGLELTVEGISVDGLSIINFSNGSGILINTTGATVSNNYIGLEADGATVAGNQFGVTINSEIANMVRNNVISGNVHGVRLIGSSSQDNAIRNNFIGTDAGGSLDKGNTTDGIRLEGSHNNLIEGNTISGNNGDGIEIGGGGTGNRVFSNKIGVFSDGTGSRPNNGYGINVSGSSNNLISNGNIIRNNSQSGVSVDTGTGNKISTNHISGNGVPGIRLVNGGNNNTPAPQLLTAANGGNYVLVNGSLTAAPNTTYVIEFFTNPGGGSQGEYYITSKSVTTNGSGNAGFTAELFTTVLDLTPITATATDPSDNTSPFSSPVFVFGDAPTLTPTFTPTSTPTETPIPTDTPVPPTNTPGPTATSSSGGGSGTINTATPTQTASITPTPTLLWQYQTLTALATNNTIEPTATLETPTATVEPSPTRVASETPTETPVPTEDPAADGGDVPAADDGIGGGEDDQGFMAGLLDENGNFSIILWIFIGLAIILLVVGGAIELMRWLNNRG